MLDNHQGLEVIDMGHYVVLWNTGQWTLYTPTHPNQFASYHVTNSGRDLGYLEGVSVIADFEERVSRGVCLLQEGKDQLAAGLQDGTAQVTEHTHTWANM